MICLVSYEAAFHKDIHVEMFFFTSTESCDSLCYIRSLHSSGTASAECLDGDVGQEYLTTCCTCWWSVCFQLQNPQSVSNKRQLSGKHNIHKHWHETHQENTAQTHCLDNPWTMNLLWVSFSAQETMDEKCILQESSCTATTTTTGAALRRMGHLREQCSC